MAALIDMSNGRANMAFTGMVPWHGLGASLPADAPLADWQKAAGLEWEASRAPVCFYRPDSEAYKPAFLESAPKFHVLYRSDTGRPLGVVSNRYQVVQPKDLIQFYSDLCASYGYQMVTAGALMSGRVIWALAQTGEADRIEGQDEIRAYVLLTTNFDGQGATVARFTSVRVVCANTLGFALSEATGEDQRGGALSFKVPHSTKFDKDHVYEALRIGPAWAEHLEQVRVLAARSVTPDEGAEFFAKVYNLMPEIEKGQARRAEKIMEQMATILQNAPGQNLRSAAGTAWGLVNAVTYAVDHNVKARSAETRLMSAWLGDGARLKQKAFQTALALVA